MSAATLRCTLVVFGSLARPATRAKRRLQSELLRGALLPGLRAKGTAADHRSPTASSSFFVNVRFTRATQSAGGIGHGQRIGRSPRNGKSTFNWTYPLFWTRLKSGAVSMGVLRGSFEESGQCTQLACEILSDRTPRQTVWENRLTVRSEIRYVILTKFSDKYAPWQERRS